MIIVDKNLNFILILLVLSESVKQIANKSPAKECVISNQKYTFEYLVNKFEIIHSTRINKVRSFDEIKWKFDNISGLNHTYFIRSSLNNLYICLSNVIDRFNLRRYVVLNDLNINEKTYSKSIFDACKWKLDKVKKDQNTYKIINKQYNAPMYAPGFIFKVTYKEVNYRKAFLWHGKSTDGDEFKWNVVCQRETPLYK